jgi:hypothetical protein
MTGKHMSVSQMQTMDNNGRSKTPDKKSPSESLAVQVIFYVLLLSVLQRSSHARIFSTSQVQKSSLTLKSSTNKIQK